MNASTFRVASTAGLILLVVLTIGITGAGMFLFVERRTHAIEQIVVDVHRDLIQAENERERADRIVRRTLRLEFHRVRLDGLVEFCTIIHLQGSDVPRCNDVKKRVRVLAGVIREFHERLRDDDQQVVPGGTSTVTQTQTRTASPEPKVGESDQCPKRNPSC